MYLRSQRFQEFLRADDSNIHIAADIAQGFVAGDDHFGLEGDGAFDEFVVIGIGFDDRELGGSCGVEHVDAAGEEFEELAELVLAFEPEPAKDRSIFLDDRG